MTTNQNDKPKNQRCFNADLIPVLVATGFTVNRKPRPQPLAWADWDREIRVTRKPV